MNLERRRYVLNLPEWELPRFEDQVFALVEELVAKATGKRPRAGYLADALHELIRDRLITLIESAANETIEYWLQGLGDGDNGQWPELCIELPYLEQGEITDPLTLAYCVDNGDDTRTELNRMTLEAVMSRYLEAIDLPARIPGRARVMAATLRKLAEKLDDL